MILRWFIVNGMRNVYNDIYIRQNGRLGIMKKIENTPKRKVKWIHAPIDDAERASARAFVRELFGEPDDQEVDGSSSCDNEQRPVPTTRKRLRQNGRRRSP